MKARNNIWQCSEIIDVLQEATSHSEHGILNPMRNWSKTGRTLQT
jgi:hypothetical protein